MILPGVYRAKAVKLDGKALTTYVPQIFGDTSISVTDVAGTTPATFPTMGWVVFQAGVPENPVWVGAVDEKVEVNAALPLGIVGYAQVTTNQTPITSVVDLTGLAVTFPATSGRRYKITGSANFFSTVAGDIANMYISTGAGATLTAGYVVCVTSLGMTLQRSIVVSSLSGSATIKLRAQRIGTGNATLSAATNIPSFILVEDLGVLSTP